MIIVITVVDGFLGSIFYFLFCFIFFDKKNS